MLFKNVVGQDKIKKQLIQIVKEGRVSHSQLFTGDEGVGCLPLALAFAQYMLCENPTENDSCGICSGCLKMSRMAHPDVHYSFPIILKKGSCDTSDDVIAQWRETVISQPYFTMQSWNIKLGGENKQGIIGTKESEAILKKLSLKSYEGGYKIMIIWRPELMNNQAANKLLKILEEPPEKTFFFLISAYPEQLLTTIISRTQLIKVPRIASADIASALQNNEGIGEGEALSISSLCNGNYIEAIKQLDVREQQDSNFNLFSEWMRICYKRDIAQTIRWSENMSTKGRERQKNFLQYSLDMFRQCVLYNYLGEDLVTIQGQEESFAKKFSPFINNKNIEVLNEEFNKGYADLERNINSKILFLDISFKVFRLLKIAKQPA